MNQYDKILDKKLRLRQVRDFFNLKQDDFANIIEVEQAHCSNMERGISRFNNCRNISLSTLTKYFLF